MNKEEYNDIPVYYCKDCLSLNIRTMDEQYDYCGKCGSLHIGVSMIDDWKQLYEGKYYRPLI